MVGEESDGPVSGAGDAVKEWMAGARAVDFGAVEVRRGRWMGSAQIGCLLAGCGVVADE